MKASRSTVLAALSVAIASAGAHALAAQTYPKGNDPRNGLKAGMYADVFISLNRSSQSVTVPSTAVATSVNGPFVIAVIGDTTHWVRVKKGDTVGDRVEVFCDLHDGERVAVRGTEEIRSGRRVQARTQLDTTQKAATPAKRKP